MPSSNFVMLGPGADQQMAAAEAADSWVATRALGKGGQGVAFLARRVSPAAARGLSDAITGFCEAATSHGPALDLITGMPGPDRKVALVRETTWLLASDWDTERYVLKFFIPRPEEHDDEHVERWKREVNILRDARHPHINQLVDCGRIETPPSPDRHIFAVYRYCSGGSLLEQKDRYRGALVPCLRAVIDVLTGLEFVHGMGVMHRDIKPANVFLDADGRAVLGDFGLVSKQPQDVALTAPAATIGAWQFAPPWRKFDTAYEPDEVFDLYMVCTTLWSLLTGVGSAEGFLPEDLDEKEFDLVQLVPNEPLVADVKQVLKRVIVKRHADVELKTAAELRAALTAVLHAAESGRHSSASPLPARCQVCSGGTYHRLLRPLLPPWVEQLHEAGHGQEVTANGTGTQSVEMFRCGSCGHLVTYARPLTWKP